MKFSYHHFHNDLSNAIKLLVTFFYVLVPTVKYVKTFPCVNRKTIFKEIHTKLCKGTREVDVNKFEYSYPHNLASIKDSLKSISFYKKLA